MFFREKSQLPIQAGEKYSADMFFCMLGTMCDLTPHLATDMTEEKKKSDRQTLP